MTCIYRYFCRVFKIIREFHPIDQMKENTDNFSVELQYSGSKSIEKRYKVAGNTEEIAANIDQSIIFTLGLDRKSPTF